MKQIRNAIVTGASRGIGLAIARRLIADGNTVLGMARSFDQNDSELPETMERMPIDLSDLTQLEKALKPLTISHRNVDTLILNAGRGEFGNLEQFSVTQIRNLIDLNLTSQILIVRAFLPNLKKLGRGDIVLMGSEAALTGHRKGAIYCATKFALRGFAQALREECASAEIRVSLVNPGMVQTPFFELLDFAPGADPENYIEADDIAEIVATLLDMRRGTSVDEINLSPLKKVVQFKKTRKQ